MNLFIFITTTNLITHHALSILADLTCVDNPRIKATMQSK